MKIFTIPSTFRKLASSLLPLRSLLLSQMWLKFHRELKNLLVRGAITKTDTKQGDVMNSVSSENQITKKKKPQTPALNTLHKLRIAVIAAAYFQRMNLSHLLGSEQ